MLHGITWMQFLASNALFLIAYYLVVASIYFKSEIAAIWQRKATAPLQAGSGSALSSQDALMPQIYELMESIKEFMQRAETQQFVANETIFGLQQLIQQYPAIKASRFVPSINNEIIQLSNELLGQPLSADEITAIWK